MNAEPLSSGATMPGVIENLTREEYDKLDRINWSRLKHIGKSPAHYRHSLLVRQKDTAPKRRGRTTHLAVLEPEKFARQCVVWDGGTRRGKAWDAFAEEHEDAEILTEDEHEECLAIAAAVRRDPVAGRYLSGGKPELSVIWTHAVEAIAGLSGYSMDCKARLDFLSSLDGGAIVDLKTTRDASPDGFARECWRYQYATQAAFYADGYAEATGKALPYLLVAVEVEPPHVVQVYRVPESVLEVGRDHYRTLLNLLHVCRTDSAWPGYADGELELTLPRWAADFSEDEDVSGLGLVINQ